MPSTLRNIKGKNNGSTNQSRSHIPAIQVASAANQFQLQTPATTTTSKTKANIKQTTELIEKLANCIAHDYTAQKTESKIGLARKWVVEIKVKWLDSKAELTKSKAAGMIAEWTEVYQ